MSTYADHENDVALLVAQRPGWSRGMAHMVVLESRYPDLAEMIRGTILDPTYHDGPLPEFQRWLGSYLSRAPAARHAC